ncbi:tetratricopeptide repeat protein [Sphingomonas sp.]|jgi:tetratricopeptide (TPR) repeat protein|uniref:tetratricopeptide repeat protein n=1 Tax=Sphingomonas sp. TaxID=28214 RepID=UPI002ED7F398
MFFPFLILISQDVPAPAEPPRFAQCMDLATGDPAQGLANATKWRSEGGGALARQCEGVAYANQGRWASAAAAFEQAARDAELAKSPKVADYHVQSGNAWLAAGEAGKARAAFDAALVTGTLAGLALGEAHLDRARALMLAGDSEPARSDIDKALENAPGDPLAWLLSATLARRTGDLKRAASDIAEALKRSPDDAMVQLEAGSIAAAAGDEANARTAWNRVIELSPGSPAAESARKALAQFAVAEK